MKVAGFIIQPNKDGTNEILAFLSTPGVLYRIIGGNVEAGEDVEVALFREVEEESGLRGLKIARKLGVQRYYKEYIDANVERHDYLLLSPTRLPERWEHTGTGGGGDDGMVFRYKWLKREEHSFLDPEFRSAISPAYIRELFS